MPKSDFLGHTTNWVREGSGVRRALFLHCFLTHSGAWGGVWKRLEAKLALYALDLPGHGASAAWPGDLPYQTMARDMARGLIETEMGGHVDIIGHSFGATVALRVAQDFPEMVRSLTLIEPVIFSGAKDQPVFDAHIERIAPFNAAVSGDDPEAAAREFHKVWGPGMPWEKIPAEHRGYMADRIHLVPAVDDVAFENALGQMDRGAIEKVDCPVLLLEGANSVPVMSAVQADFADRLPHAERVVVAGATHMLPVTHAEAVAGEIAAFLKL